ncbi:nicotinamide riboside transporter PnuC, partial [Salmonella enterica subsp. enterica serovar Kentucky]|nr:nicotinamide riboside transporter PnuC [Salmonella enterica subsp. enterica serovar Kentucky]
LSIAAMILMPRKYVENWLLWVVINVISVVIFALQGVYAMSLDFNVSIGRIPICLDRHHLLYRKNFVYKTFLLFIALSNNICFLK